MKFRLLQASATMVRNADRLMKKLEPLPNGIGMNSALCLKSQNETIDSISTKLNMVYKYNKAVSDQVLNGLNIAWPYLRRNQNSMNPPP